VTYPIVALWSHPRSMSTAFERVMRARGDMQCLHEPFMYDYYINRSPRKMPHFDVQADHPRSYEAIRDMILVKAEHAPVFFKDMSYYVVPQIHEDPEFLDRITHSFLVRDLKASIISYAKLDPDVTIEEIGIEAQWRQFNFLTQRRGRPPTVIQSEKVQADPGTQLRKYWEAVGLSDKPEALDWNQPAPSDWQQVSGWHQDVMSSKSIRPLSIDQARATQASFAQLVREQPHLLTYHDHHATYHAELLSYAI
jgi:Sulfotransferase domain